jgi:hypothetical protein
VCWRGGDVERCLRDKAINIRLIVNLVGCFIEYLKMHGITNPKVMYNLGWCNGKTFMYVRAGGGGGDLTATASLTRNAPPRGQAGVTNIITLTRVGKQ